MKLKQLRNNYNSTTMKRIYTIYTYTQFIALKEEDYYKVIDLRFSNNQLTELPESVGKCINLEYLWCNNNYLTYLPETLGNCSKLRYLWCNNNRLTYLPDTLGNCSLLQQVACRFNELTELPDTLGNCSQLQRLYCSYNELTWLHESLTQLEMDVTLPYLSVAKPPIFK